MTASEMLDLARREKCFWEYNYNAAQAGRVGKHAILQSGKHSDGFFAAKMFLAIPGVLDRVACAMMGRLDRMQIPRPDYVTGVPTSATALAEHLSPLLGAEFVKMDKVEDEIVLQIRVPDGKSVLTFEDVSSTGGSFAKATRAIRKKSPGALIIPWCPVILHRGAHNDVEVDGVSYPVVSIIEKRMTEWNPNSEAGCYLCREFDSEAIRPKTPPENWDILVHSQDE